MKKQAKMKSAVITSIIAMLLSVAMLFGTTFAWFTDNVTNTNNVIKSGNLDVELWHCNCVDAMPIGFGYVEGNGEQVEGDTKLFLNKNGSDILWEPGAQAGETFRIKNAGSLALKFEFRVKATEASATPEGKTLKDVIQVEAIEFDYNEYGTPFTPADGLVYVNYLNDGYTISGSLLAGESVDYWIGLDWTPSENDNDYNVAGGLSLSLGIELVATQASYEEDGFNGANYDVNAEFPVIPTTWDGSSDTSWYFENSEAETFYLGSAEELAGLAELVNGTAVAPASAELTLPVDFTDKTIYLTRNVNLAGEYFTPIGIYTYDEIVPFTGTFDGNGHTISNMSQRGWDQGVEHGLGLFAAVKDATIKNLTLESADIMMEFCEMGGIAALAEGDCTFENITIKNSEISNYQQSTGGIVGEAIDADIKFINCDIDETNVIEAIWCSCDCPIGGILGYTKNATVYMEGCDVSCVLDVFNDVCYAYQWYNYRYAGMLIGYTRESDANNVATASFLTAVDCTVTYGAWANYTYCQFGDRYYREQGAENTDPYWNGKTWQTAVDANGNLVVDANHVHNNADEDHALLLEFDQLFGGAKGVKGGNALEGVVITYNNK